jgi:hypothetical protein
MNTTARVLKITSRSCQVTTPSRTRQALGFTVPRSVTKITPRSGEAARSSWFRVVIRVRQSRVDDEDGEDDVTSSQVSQVAMRFSVPFVCLMVFQVDAMRSQDAATSGNGLRLGLTRAQQCARACMIGQLTRRPRPALTTGTISPPPPSPSLVSRMNSYFKAAAPPPQQHGRAGGARRCRTKRETRLCASRCRGQQRAGHPSKH